MNKTITFTTKSGDLIVNCSDDDVITMNFPVNYPIVIDICPSTANIIKAVIGDIEYQRVMYSETTRKLIVHLNDSVREDDLKALKPDIFLESTTATQSVETLKAFSNLVIPSLLYIDKSQ